MIYVQMQLLYLGLLNISLKQVSNLLRKLVNREVNSATTLLHTLCSEPTYLCEEVQEFLNVEHRKAFRAAWAKMAASAAETAARK